MDPIEIINRYYEAGSAAWEILVGHSRAVERYAAEICRQHPELGADEQFVSEAAMLHDIGICRTDAPSIHCHGTEPYICHGILGAQMLRELGLERHALVCERHTGAGISVDDIDAQQLPLPRRDMLPVSIEERIVCYADKFFSKSRQLDRAKSLEQARRSVAKHGGASAERFEVLHSMLHII